MQVLWSMALTLLFGAWLYGDAPRAYGELGTLYEHDIAVISQLEHHPYFHPYADLFRHYKVGVEEAFETGRELDRAAADGGAGAKLRTAYLKRLRALRRDQEAVEKVYVQAIGYAMRNDDFALFELLLEQRMAPLENRHLRKRVQEYYLKKRSAKRIGVAEVLVSRMELEEESRKIAMQEMQAYEEALQVLAEAEAARLRKMTAEKRLRNVIVSTKEVPGGYRFLAENMNAYTVTVSLDFSNLENFTPSQGLPLTVELDGNSSREILELTRSDPQQRASFSSTFGWVRGSATAVHDDSVLYRLPFAPGNRVEVSQGYDGASTHQGMSRYAVDFPVPVGTPVYAARGGTVVACEGSHNKGGYTKSYGQYANYIIIEHADRTLANYYHLKKGGVAVRVGDRVKAGDLIGYSGNTGYSSGPHLHFSVSKVDPVGKKRPLTLPVRFKNGTRIVTNPKRGDRYTATL